VPIAYVQASVLGTSTATTTRVIAAMTCCSLLAQEKTGLQPNATVLGIRRQVAHWEPTLAIQNLAAQIIGS